MEVIDEEGCVVDEEVSEEAVDMDNGALVPSFLRRNLAKLKNTFQYVNRAGESRSWIQDCWIDVDGRRLFGTICSLCSSEEGLRICHAKSTFKGGKFF